MSSSEATGAGRREWAGLAVLSLATMMITFDMFVLLLALPDLSADLRPDSVEQLWILDIYGFMVGGFLVTMGTLGDRIGRRKLLMIGGACFAVASVVSAFATSPAMLIGARALLGIAGATLAPSTLALITTMFRDVRQMGFAVGIWASSFTLGSILGPVVGGVVLAQFWWGAVFLLGVPIMALLLVLARTLIPEYKAPRSGRLDPVSIVMSLGAVLAVIYCLKEIAREGLQPASAVVGLVGVGMGVWFVRRQRGLTFPLLELTLFRNRSFSTMLVGLLLYGLVGAASMLFITQYFQSVAELTPLRAALMLLPGMAAGVVSSLVSPILARRIRPALLIGYGLLMVTGTFIWFTQLQPQAGTATLVIGFAIIGLGEGPLISLGTNLVVGAAPPEMAGSSSSIAQTANETGAALGVAIMGSIAAVVFRDQIISTVGSGASEAEENVATAMAVAAELPEPARSSLVTAARDAFTEALSTFAAVSAVVVFIAAVVVLTTLRHIPPTGTGVSASNSEESVDVG